MTRPILNRILVGLGFAILLASIGFWSRSCATQHTANKANSQAEQRHESAISNAAKGAVFDQEAKAERVQLQRQEDQIDRLRAEVERLRKAASQPVAPPNPPTLPEPEPPGLPVDLAPLVAKQDELIQAQDREIEGLKGHITTLTLARDAWKAAYEDSSKEAALRKIAFEAQLAAIRAERWKGRIEGVVVGLGTGYLAGRLR